MTGDGRSDVLLGTEDYDDQANAYKLFLFRQEVDHSLGPPLRLGTEGLGPSRTIATGDLGGDTFADAAIVTYFGIDVYEHTGRGSVGRAGGRPGNLGRAQDAGRRF